MIRLATFMASLALVAACGMTYSPAPGATPSPISTGRPTESPGPTVTLAPVPTGPSAEIEVFVSGGGFDGSYRAVAANACESKPALNIFAVEYANDSAADDFTALSLTLRNAAQAQEDASSEFRLELSLHGAGGGVSYALDPAEGEGEGDAYLDLTESEATLDLSIIAPDDTLIDVTVICELAAP